MAEVIEMLALSPTMDEGTLVAWHIKEGDEISEGEVIAEIETDKATMEMESFFTGTVLKILVNVGDALPVGTPLAIVGEPGESLDGVLDDQTPHDAALASSQQEVQDSVKKESEVSVGEKTDSSDLSSHQDRIFVSPLARKIAAEKGLDLSKIKGSGPNGRVVKSDVETATTQKVALETTTPVVTTTQLPITGQTQQLSQMRKTIAKRLKQAWQEVPHFFLTMSIDMAATMKLRQKLNAELAANEIKAKISVNDFIIKASALALKAYPNMNRSFREDHFVSFDQADIGVAVAIEDGLITPVIRQAENLSLTAISNQVRLLASRAKEKKLKPEEYTGANFSISNLGMYGIEQFNAIINPPESGILACGAVQQQPVVNEAGELSVGTVMKVTLSCDHRIVDGATGAEFLNLVKKYLENPMLMLV